MPLQTLTLLGAWLPSPELVLEHGKTKDHGRRRDSKESRSEILCRGQRGDSEDSRSGILCRHGARKHTARPSVDPTPDVRRLAAPSLRQPADQGDGGEDGCRPGPRTAASAAKLVDGGRRGGNSPARPRWAVSPVEGADRGGRRVRPCPPPLRARPVGSSRPSGRGADGAEAAGPGGTRSSVAGAQPSPAPEPGHPRPRPARAHSQSPAQAFTSRRRSSPGYGHGRTASSGQARTSGKSSAPTRNLDTCPGAGVARDASTSRVPGRPVSTGRRTLHTSPTAGPRPAFASRLTRPPDSLPCPGRVYSPPWNVSIS